jgi:hypothetical protein
MSGAVTAIATAAAITTTVATAVGATILGSTIAAAAVTGAIVGGVSGAVSAAVTGRDIGEGLTQGVIFGGVGGGIGSAVKGVAPAISKTVEKTTGAGYETAKQIGQAGGAFVGGTGAGLVMGQDLDDALKGGLVAGGTTAAMNLGRSISKEFQPEGTNTTGTRTSSGLQPGQKIPTSPFGTTETVSKTSPYGTMTYDTMPSMTYLPSFFDRGAGELVAEAAEEYASDLIGNKLASSLGLIPSGAESRGSGLPAPASTATYTGTGAGTGAGTSAGTAALAQALRVADPGSPLFSPAGGQQEGVWNTESLRYKDQNRS